VWADFYNNISLYNVRTVPGYWGVMRHSTRFPRGRNACTAGKRGLRGWKIPISTIILANGDFGVTVEEMSLTREKWF